MPIERLRDNEYLDVTPGIQSNEAIVRARDNVFDSQGSSGEPRMGDITALSGVRGKGYGHVTVWGLYMAEIPPISGISSYFYSFQLWYALNIFAMLTLSL